MHSHLAKVLRLNVWEVNGRAVEPIARAADQHPAAGVQDAAVTGTYAHESYHDVRLVRDAGERDDLITSPGAFHHS